MKALSGTKAHVTSGRHEGKTVTIVRRTASGHILATLDATPEGLNPNVPVQALFEDEELEPI